MCINARHSRWFIIRWSIWRAVPATLWSITSLFYRSLPRLANVTGLYEIRTWKLGPISFRWWMNWLEYMWTASNTRFSLILIDVLAFQGSFKNQRWQICAISYRIFCIFDNLLSICWIGPSSSFNSEIFLFSRINGTLTRVEIIF